MYTVFTKAIEVESLDRGEILRYMRARGTTDSVICDAVSRAEASVLRAAGCMACYTRLPVERAGEDIVMLGHMSVKSRDLSRRLSGCDGAYLFCVTAGVGVDRVIRQAQVVSPLLSLACDAAGSALVETACDMLCTGLSKEEEVYGREIVERFSAGYGDLPLEWQRDITEVLRTARHIGASLTEGLMMSPTKTVTAVLGVKRK